uniref:Restriction endonuclease subunit S n=1 Tax=Streptomyces sp. NBC_01393 TaxID=2903851 RepID=A0AAU3HU75_9ACTN
MTIVRLRHLAEVNPLTPAFNRLEDEEELTFLPMEAVWPGERLDTSRRRTKASVATGYTRFQDGDVLVPKITPTFEAGRAVLIRGLHRGLGTGSTELHVLRPGPLIDPRFLLYAVNTHDFLKKGEAEMYGVAGQQRVPDTFLRDLTVNLPALAEQRRITNFLDAETARIDRLLEYRSAQLNLLAEHERAMLDRSFQKARSGAQTRLKYLFSVRPRYGVLVPIFADAGVPFIRVNDLLDLEGRAGGLHHISSDLSAQYPRSIVQPGDLLMSVVGTLGRTAIAPASLAGANIARAVCSMRFMPDVEVQLVEAWLGTSSFREQALVATSTDTAQPTLGMEDLGNFSLVWPSDPQERKHMVREIIHIQGSMRQLSDKLERQKSVLAERRQALITTIVTGQIDVSTASGRGIEE